jgi:pimeloyl-ACP methyl ester carboxylesterase
MAAGINHPILVAHSMGGLVARAYVAKGGEIAKLVTLGTPHLGSPLAKLADIICFMNYPGSQDIKPDGGFIQGMLTNANDIQNRGKYVLFVGQMKGKFKIIKLKLKWVWEEDYYETIDKVGYYAFYMFSKPPNDGLVPIPSGYFEGYNVLERKPLLEWVDHRNLRNPEIATEVMDYINGL